jgi:hypothetical protein
MRCLRSLSARTFSADSAMSTRSDLWLPIDPGLLVVTSMGARSAPVRSESRVGVSLYQRPSTKIGPPSSEHGVVTTDPRSHRERMDRGHRGGSSIGDEPNRFVANTLCSGEAAHTRAADLVVNARDLSLHHRASFQGPHRLQCSNITTMRGITPGCNVTTGFK